MAKKRKSTRMFSRDERRRARAEQLARARTITQDELDRATIAAAGFDGGILDDPIGLAESYIGVHEDDGDDAVARALRRRYAALTGEPALTLETAAGVLEAEEDRREAEREARWLTTDAGYEERILDAQVAAQQPGEEE